MKRWVLVFAVGVFFLYSCNSPGPGPGAQPELHPQYTSQDFSVSWNLLRQSLAAVQSAAISDPEVNAVFEGVSYLLSNIERQLLRRITVGEKSTTLFNPASFMLFEVWELPRGGYDYIDPNYPTTFTPIDPIDLEVKWTTGIGKTGSLAIDWDDGQPTIFVNTRDGDQAERPQQASGHIDLNGKPIIVGRLSAFWASCGDSQIDEPIAFEVGFNVSTQEGSLDAGVEVEFDHAADDHLALRVINTIGNSVGNAYIAAEFSARGVTRRNEQCYTVRFNADRADFSTRIDVVNKSSREALSAEVSAAFTNVVLDSKNSLILADVEGYVKLEEKVAMIFEGTLDDLDQPCPGRHVVLHFTDGDMALRDWLISTGQCPGPVGKD